MTKIIVFAIAVLTLVVVASRWLPWWAAAVLIPASVLGMIGYGWWRVKRWWSQTLKEGVEVQTLVLRGATVHIHGVQLVEPPPHIRAMDEDEEDEDDEDADDDEDDDEGPLVDPASLEVDRYVSVEMTVVPDPSALEGLDPAAERPTPERTWDPMAFDLAAIDCPKPSLLGMFAASSTARMVECLDDGGTVLRTIEADSEDEDGEKASDHHIEGPSRLRVLFAVTRNLADRVKLRYCFVEDLTTITLPERDESSEPGGPRASEAL